MALLVASGGLIVIEGFIAAKRTYLTADSAPPIEGHFAATGKSKGSLKLVMIGDSTAAGVGATATDGSVGGHLSESLGDAGFDVQLSSVAVSGSRVSDLSPQVSRALMGKPDLAVILIGANDATHFSGLNELRHELNTDVRRLTDAGVQVVIGTCPEMRAGLAFMRPARDIVAWQGRRVARTERKAIRGTGAQDVDIQKLTGPTFLHDTHRYLSSDRFHPNDEGYGVWSAALFPTVESDAAAALKAHAS